ncbi:MAG: PAS domain-containing protein, partial [Bacteroidales bacterium]|nr:PAS domain-containing protein [Bacteroidales bacterium]
GAAELCFLLLALTLYAFGYAFELSSNNLQDILFWLKIEYTGISFIPALLILLALQLTDRGHFITAGMLILLLSLSSVTLILHYSNLGQFFYRDLRINSNGTFTLAAFSKGLWYWAHQIYANTALLISCILYALMAIHATGIKRSRSLLLLIASVIPWGFYLVYLTGESSDNLDIVPFSFAFIGILYVVGISRYQLLDFFPLALEEVFESMSSAVIILDKNKRLAGFNRKAVTTIPALDNEMTGKPVHRLQAMNPSLSNLIQTKGQTGAEIDIIQDNKPKHFYASINPVIRKRGKLLGYTVILNEISASKQKENELIEKEKNLKKQNLTKDKLLAIIAHDLRNPFHVIINLSEIILRHAESGDLQGVSRTAKILHDTSRTTYNLLQNLLEWSTIQKEGMRLQLKTLKINELVAQEIQELKHFYEQKYVTVKHKIPARLSVQADEQMIKTVLRNIILNAIKYSYPNHVVVISAKDSEDCAVVEITDQGTGMTKEELSNLFNIDKNFTKRGTASEAGSGFGLLLCKELIQMHGGIIAVNSHPGKGSTFSFTLPHRSKN